MAKPTPSPALQAKYDDFSAAQEIMRSLVKKQETLTASRTETDMVNTELGDVKAEEPVFKLMGKMLVRQEIGEARATISQRLNMIDRELFVFIPREAPDAPSLQATAQNFYTLAHLLTPRLFS